MTRLASSNRQRLLRIEELEQLTKREDDAFEVLPNVATLVGNLLQADVCSVYLLEADETTLVLAATVGLEQSCVRRLRMRLDEGLTGLVAQQRCVLAVKEAAKHRRFKYFPESGEEFYESFLGAPLMDHGMLQGVLVVQQIESRCYERDDVERIEQVATALGPVVRAARRGIPFFVHPSVNNTALF